MISHTSNEYEEELASIRDQVINMGGLVEEMYINSTTALLKNKPHIAKDTQEVDKKVNGLEVTIDEECATIIARRQPKAIDLRNVFAIIKIVTDLERIGDEAKKIARFSNELEIDAKEMNIYKNLKSLIASAKNMLKDALDCYARLDSEKALQITTADSEIDQEYEKLNRLLSTYLLEDSKNIKSILNVMWCSRAIERVGDHSKNICEYVIYIVQGTDIRHKKIAE